MNSLPLSLIRLFCAALFCAALLLTGITAQQAQLLADVNRQVPPNPSSNPRGFLASGQNIYFFRPFVAPTSHGFGGDLGAPVLLTLGR